MKKRFLMVAHLAFWLCVFFTLGASAYLDPSVVTGLATAVAGVVVACSAAFFVIWRKVKHGVSKTLGIDENANKEVEEDLQINDEPEVAEPETEPEIKTEAEPTEQKN